MLQGSAQVQLPHRVFEHQIAQQTVVRNRTGLQCAPRLSLVQIVVGKKGLTGEQNRGEPEKGQNDEQGKGEQIGAESS